MNGDSNAPASVPRCCRFPGQQDPDPHPQQHGYATGTFISIMFCGIVLISDIFSCIDIKKEEEREAVFGLQRKGFLDPHNEFIS
jgi:hypothetical protein